MTHNQHIYNIGYRGGSGGFLFLHFLLLSEQYYADIFNNIDFSDVVTQQWNITNHCEWKNTEFWPNNCKSINDSSNLNKVVYFCNPSTDEFFKKKQLFDHIVSSYNDIKDTAWPVITSAADFFMLPNWIYQEVCNTLNCTNLLKHFAGQLNTKSVWVYTDFDSQNELAYYKKAYFYSKQPLKEKIQDLPKFTEIWNEISVDKKAVYFLNHSDIQIKLQDLVNSPDSLIDQGLIDYVSQKQHNLLTHWKSLHPPELLKKIGIK